MVKNSPMGEGDGGSASGFGGGFSGVIAECFGGEDGCGRGVGGVGGIERRGPIFLRSDSSVVGKGACGGSFSSFGGGVGDGVGGTVDLAIARGFGA